ncbi:MAG: lamin tail domain-containing protein [Bacteroidota bacterium]
MSKLIPFYTLILGLVPLTAQIATDFSEVSASPFDIIINEIMEDATIDGGGTLGLPAVEYVELYNRSDKVINLADFEFSDGGAKPAVFPDYEFTPDTYLLIGKKSADTLSKFGDFLGLANFPTLSATETLTLKNEFGDLIDVVSYTQDWYGSTATASGGYSLERINPQSPCEGITNWRGSASFLGGTPNDKNAVFDLSAEGGMLNIIDAYPLSATQIRLSFNKKISEAILVDPDNYSITNHTIGSVSLIESSLQAVVLNLQNPLLMNAVEIITVASNFSDCLGNLIDGKTTYPIALPTLPGPSDIIINELLFNPQTGGADFVELYNRSEKVFDLSLLFLANQALDNPQLKPIEAQKLLFPKDFVVFTERPIDLLERYTVENPSNLLTQDLPTFPDQEGNVLLYINDGTETIFLDEFDYTADFHNPLLNDKNGVSLERINPNLPTQDAGNWNSAAQTAGFATPTYQNSQISTASTKESENIFSLSNKRISPDGDGFEDILQINYVTDKAGYAATVQIFDAAGRLIDRIAQNELLGTSGSFKWEGTTFDGQKASIGIYVLWIEYFNVDGQVGRMKEAITVASKL